MSNKNTNDIPKGSYCYTRDSESNKIKICKYWSKIKVSEDDSLAVCSFLEKDENDDSYYLLNDQVKCCGINEEDEEYD
jgi:hypothetical protein